MLAMGALLKLPAQVHRNHTMGKKEQERAGMTKRQNRTSVRFRKASPKKAIP